MYLFLQILSLGTRCTSDSCITLTYGMFTCTCTFFTIAYISKPTRNCHNNFQLGWDTSTTKKIHHRKQLIVLPTREMVPYICHRVSDTHTMNIFFLLMVWNEKLLLLVEVVGRWIN